MDSQAEKRLMLDCMAAGAHLGEVMTELDASQRALFLASIPFGLERVRGAVRQLFEVFTLYQAQLDKAADVWGEAPETRDLPLPVKPGPDSPVPYHLTQAGLEAIAHASVTPVSGLPKPGPDVINPTERHEHQTPTGGAATSVPAGEKCACGNLDGPGTHTPNTCRYNP